MTDKKDKPDDPDDKPPGASGEFEDRWDDPLKRAEEARKVTERATASDANAGNESVVAERDLAGDAAAIELAEEARKIRERVTAPDADALARAEEERLLTERAAAARAEEERLEAERSASELDAARRADEERAAAMQAEIQRAQEKRAAEQREADERAAAAREAAEAKRLAEKRAAEENVAKMRAEDLAEDARRAEAQRAADRRAAEQRDAEKRLAEQRDAERLAAEENERRAEDKRVASGKGGGSSSGGGGLALGEAAAGAGALGLIGAAAIFIVAIVFFVAESFFLATLLISFALLVYVAGAELGKLLWSSLTVFFSSKHLIKNAVYISDTVVALRKALHMRRDDAGNIKVGPIEPGTKIKLPDNPLVRELQVVLKRKKGKEYAEYVAHQYYVDCRELYDHFHAHLDFVANVMPLFGLIGTVIGLIGMFDRLGSNTSIENLSPQLAISLQCTLWGAIFASLYMTVASRFDQRVRALEYDFDILLHSFDVLVENGAEIELQA